ncbi:hypothetical protein [uncultured Microbulbifer sp.]|uniref:hypothetical protein n=1 Tax=uncultured Microbulbifer sp. TaxID=348147 RepID=UPI002623CBEB|nr:hypothetical protein [uncultured Microbulbifer sp.]
MDVQIKSVEPTEEIQAPKPEMPEWTKFAGNETADLPAGIEADTPIAIRLRQGTELAVFAGDSFDLPLGDWDHDDHEKDIVAYRLLSAEEAREFIRAQAVIEYFSGHLEEEIDRWHVLVEDLKVRFSNPLFKCMMPKLVVALHCPADCEHKAVTANTSKSQAWLLQQVMPAFSEPSK